MENAYLTGYISVSAALISESRRVYRVFLDADRYEKVKKSRFHLPEKQQYAFLKSYCAANKIRIFFLAQGELAERFGTESGGIAAEVGGRLFTPLAELLAFKNPYLVAIDGIEDPYNFGQVLRSFYAAGVDGVVVPSRNFFTASAIVARASAGASERLKISAVDSMEDFCKNAAEKGIRLYATTSKKDAADLYKTEFSRPLCVFFGGEKRGISAKILELCGRSVTISYPRSTEIALSASSAAAVAAFEIGRRIN